MLASNGKQQMHELFLKLFRQHNPTLPPYILMDRDIAAFNAARAIYPEVPTYLCWFHLVCAWWKHINVPKNLPVWKLLLRLPRAETQQEFDSLWVEIKSKAPKGFIEYMEEYWIPGASSFVPSPSVLSKQPRTVALSVD